MHESSRRILVDRSVIRLDGRPFFSFGPRLLLTPQDRMRQALKEIAAAGFTTVGSPPCSPGTLPLMHAVFDAAEEVGLMVVLIADPRLPEHGRYMAEHFRHRPSLHSYVLSPRPATKEALNSYQRERDSIGATDLFHPVCAPLTPDQFEPSWLKAQDVYTPLLVPREKGSTHLLHQEPGHVAQQLASRVENAPQRPILFTNLRVCTSDEQRALGVYSDDSWVSRLSPNSLDWFPYLANIGNTPRKDMLGPDPEILRLQVYDALASGARGMLLDFFEALGGPMPYSGRDRFCEAAILAQEIAIFNDFFAEGKPEPLMLETGHPRVGATVLRHGLDYLIVMRLNGYEEDYFVDEAYMQRTEIDLMLEGAPPVHAWRLDFPGAQPLELQRDRAGAIRFLAGPMELTALILLTPGTQRSQDFANAVQSRLPLVARLAVELLEVRFAKLLLIEGELSAMGVGVNNEERLRLIHRTLDEARLLLKTNEFDSAYLKARSGARLARQVVKYQMAKALATPVFERSASRANFRASYYTLPRFYREGAVENALAFTDIT